MLYISEQILDFGFWIVDFGFWIVELMMLHLSFAELRDMQKNNVPEFKIAAPRQIADDRAGSRSVSSPAIARHE